MGFAKKDGSNVRADSNTNSESLCRLRKGDPVKIVGKRYGWFRIILPGSAYLYVKNDFVELTPETNVGIIRATRVNLRAGPGTKHSILGQVSEPQEVYVLTEEEGGWYKIVPAGEKITGWMHSGQVRFDIEADEKERKDYKPRVRLLKEE